MTVSVSFYDHMANSEAQFRSKHQESEQKKVFRQDYFSEFHALITNNALYATLRSLEFERFWRVLQRKKTINSMGSTRNQFRLKWNYSYMFHQSFTIILVVHHFMIVEMISTLVEPFTVRQLGTSGTIKHSGTGRF